MFDPSKRKKIARHDPHPEFCGTNARPRTGGRGNDPIASSLRPIELYFTNSLGY